MAVPQMREVYSSNVDRIGYSDASKELWVQWGKSGKVSVYEGVPPDVAKSVMNSWSIGSAVRDQIKPNFQHRYAG